MGKIIWSKSAQVIDHQIRGLQPWPGAFFYFGDKMVKVLQAKTETAVGKNSAGQVLAVDKTGIHVACALGVLVLQEVHPQAGKPMPAAAFAAGYKIVPGVHM